MLNEYKCGEVKAIRQIDGPVSVDGHDDDGILDN